MTYAKKKQKKKEMCKFREIAPPSAFSKNKLLRNAKNSRDKERGRKKRDEQKKNEKKKENMKISRDGATMSFSKKNCSEIQKIVRTREKK